VRVICVSHTLELTAISRLPPLLYDLFLLVLTVYKCVQTAPSGDWRRTPLIWVLIRDGSWAFAVVLGM
jgi:hypothetical protein